MAQESSLAQGSTMEQLAEWCHFLRVEGSSTNKVAKWFWLGSIYQLLPLWKKKEEMGCNKYEEGSSKAGAILKIWWMSVKQIVSAMKLIV